MAVPIVRVLLRDASERHQNRAYSSRVGGFHTCVSLLLLEATYAYSNLRAVYKYDVGRSTAMTRGAESGFASATRRCLRIVAVLNRSGFCTPGHGGASVHFVFRHCVSIRTSMCRFHVTTGAKNRIAHGGGHQDNLPCSCLDLFFATRSIEWNRASNLI